MARQLSIAVQKLHLCSVTVLLLLCLAALYPRGLSAQTLGAIEGIVKDSSGALLPKASVTVTNTSTSAVRNGVSDGAGLYNFAALPPGPYTVRVQGAGFKSEVRDVVLEVQQTAQIDFSMQPGSTDQVIDVTATTAEINNTDATVGTVIGEKQILELPLNGRDFLQLVALSSNVTTNFPSPGQAALRQGGSRAAENYSISGLRGTSNYYTLDGVSNTDVNFNLIIMQPSIDALQEFKVQTGVYPSQFGREAAQINISTKSGTNKFHGSAFEFLRNDVLDAKSYDFNQSRPAKNPFKWNQFGFTIGGPVVIPKLFNGHNKLFFLSNFEDFRLRQSATTLYTVPTLAQRAGNFSNLLPGNQLYDPSTKTNVNGVITGTPFVGNIIPASKINSVSTKLLTYFPLPNVASATTVNNYQRAVASPLNKLQFTQRVDFNQSDKMSWFARYTLANEDSLTGGSYLNGGTVLTNAKQAVLGNTRIVSPTKVNDVRIAWNNFKNVASTELASVTDVVDSLGIPGLSTPNPLTWGIPQISGFTDGISVEGNTPVRPSCSMTRPIRFWIISPGLLASIRCSSVRTFAAISTTTTAMSLGAASFYLTAQRPATPTPPQAGRPSPTSLQATALPAPRPSAWPSPKTAPPARITMSMTPGAQPPNSASASAFVMSLFRPGMTRARIQ